MGCVCARIYVYDVPYGSGMCAFFVSLLLLRCGGLGLGLRSATVGIGIGAWKSWDRGVEKFGLRIDCGDVYGIVNGC